MMLLRKGGEIMSPAYSSEVAYESDLAQYRNDEHAFDEHSRALGQVFASHAAVAMKADDRS